MPPRRGARAGNGTAHERWRCGFSQGFLTNVLNPKAALFFLSVLPQFVHGGGSVTRQILFLGILDILIGVVLVRPRRRRRTVACAPLPAEDPPPLGAGQVLAGMSSPSAWASQRLREPETASSRV
ncbi:hypothetical protein SGLAM104S_09312 [Streptomyces glaucescens]